MKHCALIFFPSLILSQQSRAWDRLVRWRCEKRSARVPRESNGRQTHSLANLHEADSAEWKISGNYWLVVDLLAQESKGKKGIQIWEWIDDSFHYLIKRGRWHLNCMNLTLSDDCFNIFFLIKKNYRQVYSLHVCLCLISVWTPVA